MAFSSEVLKDLRQALSVHADQSEACRMSWRCRRSRCCARGAQARTACGDDLFDRIRREVSTGGLAVLEEFLHECGQAAHLPAENADVPLKLFPAPKRTSKASSVDEMANRGLRTSWATPATSDPHRRHRFAATQRGLQPRLFLFRPLALGDFLAQIGNGLLQFCLARL